VRREVRIIGSRAPETQPIDDLPSGVEEGVPYTVRSAVRTPPAGTSFKRIRPTAFLSIALGIGLLVAFSVTTLAILIMLIAGDSDIPTSVQTELRVVGQLGEDKLSCTHDIVTVAVDTAGSPSGVAVASLEAGGKTMRVVLDGVDGGYVGHVYVVHGAISDSPFVMTGRLTVSPGAALIVSVDGLLEARRVLVDGRPARLGASRSETCS
jgi:hypothetical protein